MKWMILKKKKTLALKGYIHGQKGFMEQQQGFSDSMSRADIDRLQKSAKSLLNTLQLMSH